jgi:HAD superfamily hydrolase (TIGR01484 family)
MKYHHFLFDMDGTLTDSRTEATEEIIDMLNDLSMMGATVTIISGALISQMRQQLPYLDDGIFLLAESGNYTRFWKNKLTKEQKERINKHIQALRADYGYLFRQAEDENDLIQDRGCQLTLSLVGHHADKDLKREFDPKGEKRNHMLKTTPFIDAELCARVGGTTSIDYTIINGTKGKNLQRWLLKKHWYPEDCVYIGDALYPGGNDESVIEVIPSCISTTGPLDTLKIVNDLCK